MDLSREFSKNCVEMRRRMLIEVELDLDAVDDRHREHGLLRKISNRPSVAKARICKAFEQKVAEHKEFGRFRLKFCVLPGHERFAVSERQPTMSR